ncbi:hypothetical protein MRB53_039404 [Persea americana]|nr:hypothetical protein MRB53_039404 [Persea americana]
MYSIYSSKDTRTGLRVNLPSLHIHGSMSASHVFRASSCLAVAWTRNLAGPSEKLPVDDHDYITSFAPEPACLVVSSGILTAHFTVFHAAPRPSRQTRQHPHRPLYARITPLPFTEKPTCLDSCQHPRTRLDLSHSAGSPTL